MKIRPQKIVDELLLLSFIVRPTSLIFEDNVVVPASFDIEVGLSV